MEVGGSERIEGVCAVVCKVDMRVRVLKDDGGGGEARM